MQDQDAELLAMRHARGNEHIDAGVLLCERS